MQDMHSLNLPRASITKSFKSPELTGAFQYTHVDFTCPPDDLPEEQKGVGLFC